MKKKHTAVDNDTFPQTCHLCENTCENRYELKKHLITHSYKEAKYMCSECSFVCQNEVSMEVHIGKQHCEKFECGLCNLEVGNYENLELHLTTCEMYRCQKCEKRYKPNHIRDLKKHIADIHKREAIEHLKLDRNDCNEVSEKVYGMDKI